MKPKRMIDQNLFMKASEMNPPSKVVIKEVPIKFVTMFAAVGIG